MSGGGRGRKPRTGLSAEEQALWEHAASSMTPLARAKGRLLDGADDAVFEPVHVTVRRKGKVVDAGKPLPGIADGAGCAGEWAVAGAGAGGVQSEKRATDSDGADRNRCAD